MIQPLYTVCTGLSKQKPGISKASFSEFEGNVNPPHSLQTIGLIMTDKCSLLQGPGDLNMKASFNFVGFAQIP